MEGLSLLMARDKIKSPDQKIIIKQDPNYTVNNFLKDLDKVTQKIKLISLSRPR